MKREEEKSYDMYSLPLNKKFSFKGVISEFIVDSVPCYKCASYDYEKLRVILTDVQIFDGEKYIDFEDVKMEAGARFRAYKENDIVTFDACVGEISPFENGYEEDGRGSYRLEVRVKPDEYSRWETDNVTWGTWNEIEKDFDDLSELKDEMARVRPTMSAKAMINTYGCLALDVYCSCKTIRRLKSPSKLKKAIQEVA